MNKLLLLLQMLTLTFPGTAHSAEVQKTEAGSAKIGAATPLDQSTDPKDIKLTQNIRQRLMDDKNLSFSAQNVKIITQKGKVVLEGIVPTAKDRTRVESHAKKVAGAKAVTNQIKVSK